MRKELPLLMAIAIVYWAPPASSVSVLATVLEFSPLNRLFIIRQQQGGLPTLLDGADIEAIERMSKESNLMDANSSNGGSGRAIIGDIEKIKKVANLLEAVGGAIIPVISETIVNSVNSERSVSANAAEPSTAAKVIPRGLHFLHAAIAQAGGSDSEPNVVEEAARIEVEEERMDAAAAANDEVAKNKM